MIGGAVVEKETRMHRAFGLRQFCWLTFLPAKILRRVF